MEARNKDHASGDVYTSGIGEDSKNFQLVDFFGFPSHCGDANPPSCAFAKILSISAWISCKLVFNDFASSNLR